ncbi:hypothetical protein CMUS01_16723, partial [Colletotrichum musicola]
MILKVMKTDDLQLTKYDFHPRWWLNQRCDLHDVLLKIGLSDRCEAEGAAKKAKNPAPRTVKPSLHRN